MVLPKVAIAQAVKYKSQLDEIMTIRELVVAPGIDNLKGIYSIPLTSHLVELLGNDPQWMLSPYNDFSKTTPADLAISPDKIKLISKQANASGLLQLRLTKGPKGINASLTLYSGADGQPLLVSKLDNYDRFEMVELKSELQRMLKDLKNKLPYRGMVISRRGLEITINLGRNSGIRQDSDISLIQLLKVDRHPKLGFIVGSEKEILGKARVFKVDDELSFATLLMERENGVIVSGTKVLPDEYIKYPEPIIAEDGSIIKNAGARPDKDVSYGAKPTEWLPAGPAQYGKFQGLLGLAQYVQSATFDTRGTVTGTNNLAPMLSLSGELWMNKDWYGGLELRQSAFSVENELGGSSPTNVNISLSKYHIVVGRNFLLGDDFFGPKIQLTAGFAKFNSTADDTNPTVFTKIDYGGMVFGFVGQFPLGTETPTDLGIQYKYYWNPKVNETKSSGSPGDVKVTDFGLFSRYHVHSRLSYVGLIDFEYYSTSFSGGGDRTLTISQNSHKITSILAGIEYLF